MIFKTYDWKRVVRDDCTEEQADAIIKYLKYNKKGFTYTKEKRLLNSDVWTVYAHSVKESIKYTANKNKYMVDTSEI